MSQELDFIKLFAGLGIFLYGMSQLEAGLKTLAGTTFRRFLRQTTSKPVGSVFAGVVATTIVQSSSLVNLIVLAFVGAGIIPLVNAIGIVVGSNLGTTLTGWIVATLGFKLDLQSITLPLLGLGGFGYAILKNKWQSFSLFIIGFSLLLIGLGLMKTSVIVIATQFDFQYFADFPLIFFLFFGLFLTALIQSSSATMIITLSALNAQIISLPVAAAVIIGADLGTTSTVLLGSIQGAVSKRRVAMAQVLFNLSVDAVAFILITPALQLITNIIGITDPLYVLVMFHSLFNLLGVIIFIPVLKPFSLFLEQRIKEDLTDVRQYISEVPANVSDAALEAIKLEARRLLQMVMTNNLHTLKITKEDLHISDDEYKFLNTVQDRHRVNYEDIKRLEGEIVQYAIEVQRSNLEPEEVKRLESLLSAVRYGVYSAKSLKDIHSDLGLFAELEHNEITSQFEPLKQHVIEIYSITIGLINKHHNSAYFSEEIKELHSSLVLFQHEFIHKLYKTPLVQTSELELSTLMNVSRELRASCEAILAGISHIWGE